MRLVVTGGAGFIGSNFIRVTLQDAAHEVLNIDNLSIHGSVVTIQEFENSRQYRFVKADIRDEPTINRLVWAFRPEAIIHFAAQSHVDRSIDKSRGVHNQQYDGDVQGTGRREDIGLTWPQPTGNHCDLFTCQQTRSLEA